MEKSVFPIVPSEDQKAADFFLALANESRCRILFLLLSRNDLSVSHIAEGAKISMNRISDHLGMLRQQRILISHKQGREVFYHLDPHLIPQRCARFLQSLGISLTKSPLSKSSTLATYTSTPHKFTVSLRLKHSSKSRGE